ncbi:MAG: ATP-binding protein [Alistipes senegalensis]|nr:ATP-binding protein [Oxalobacter formigenes]MCM1280634.1 ATP-binding protein [Alistipes senegalensis]
MTRTFRTILITGGAVMGILLFLLASGAENTRLFEQHYAWLLGLNILAGIALLGLIVLMLIRFAKRYRRGRFGSRLMMRLMLLFVLMGIIPGAVIYAVSVQFVSRSIESWFDVRVEAALDSGVKLGQNMLESSLSDLDSRAEQLSAELSSLSLSEQMLALSRLKNDKNRLEAAIITGNGQVIATSSADYQNLIPDLPTPAMLRQATATSRYLAIEGKDDDPQTLNTDETALKLRVIIPLSPALGVHYRQETRLLQLIQPVSASLAADAEALRNAYSEYQVRSLSRSGLRKIYIVTLTLTLLLAVFAATAIAFQIASDLTRPLLLLAQGTKAVAEGDLSPRITVTTPDELGSLVQSFNDMTRQLAEAHTQTEKSRIALESANAYLQSVLTNMSAGVIVLDHTFCLVSCNEPVTRILRQDLAGRTGSPLAKMAGLETFATAITQAFSELSAQTAASEKKAGWHYWQKQIEIPWLPAEGEDMHDIMLLARGSRLPVEGENGYIIVFDDITDIISAQRSLAWGEVARRLAHEIKNPLTPIQLSAERLQMKLAGKLPEQEAQFLGKNTQTIINQVTAMKRMVDDFRNYARTPPAQLAALDLNLLVEDIAYLYAGDNSRDKIHTRLDPGLPRIMGDETQLRQVIHNLLQNALDAVDETPPPESAPRIDVTTEKVTYHNASGEICIAVRLSVMDNGPGFQPKILSRIFEPYTTTKERGTGLGMVVVKKIIDEHHGRIDVKNREDTSGAIVSILLLQLAQETAFAPSCHKDSIQ